MVTRGKFVAAVAVALTTAVALSSCGGVSAGAGTSSAPPAPPASSPAAASPPVGGSLDPAAVQAAWWTWAASAPSGRNPVEDGTGEFCAANQPDGMWFLAGTFGGTAHRRCAVPAGRRIVAPLVNRTGATATECTEMLDSATGSLVVDGKPQGVLRWSGVEITSTGVAGNPVSQGAGEFGGFACGLWGSTVLAAGKHTVAIRGKAGTFSVAVDYELTIG